MSDTSRRWQRLAAVLGTAAAALIAFGVLGGVGSAKNRPSAAHGQYGKKVVICHKGKKTTKISTRAWPAHKRHGDTLGPCTLAKKHKGKKHRKHGHGKHKGSSDTSLGTKHGKGSVEKHGKSSGEKQNGGRGDKHGKDSSSDD